MKMYKSYCGKNCDNCEYKESLGCPGCESWAEGKMGTSCEVISCCRIRMQDSCMTCTSREVCENAEAHQTVPEYIQNTLKYNYGRKDRIKERVKVADKWKKLFNWGLALVIINYLINSIFTDVIPEAEIISSAFEVVAVIACAIILLQMASAEKRYRIAGCVKLGYAVACIILLLLPDAEELIAAAVGMVLLGVSDFLELKCHRCMLAGVDDDLERMWKNLSIWFVNIWCIICIGIAVVLLYEELEFGAVIILLAALGLVVVDIIKLVYLFKSGRVFKVLAQEIEFEELLEAEETVTEW